MTKRFIINADDFGLSRSVNEAVASACEFGVLSSATVMANMPAFDEAVIVAKSLPKLGVGVHLNILRGTPLSDGMKNSGIVGKNGKFLGSAAKLYLKFLLGQVDLGLVRKELCAQVAKVVSAGILPTHLDGEKHLQVLIPQMWELTCSVADEFSIKCVRIPRESLDWLDEIGGSDFKQRLKAKILNARSNGFSMTAARYGLRSTNRFFGLGLTGKMTQVVYRQIFNKSFNGNAELMCHPAVSADASTLSGEESWLDSQRVAEYSALVDPEMVRVLADSCAKLITFRDLN